MANKVSLGTLIRVWCTFFKVAGLLLTLLAAILATMMLNDAVVAILLDTHPTAVVKGTITGREIGTDNVSTMICSFEVKGRPFSAKQKLSDPSEKQPSKGDAVQVRHLVADPSINRVEPVPDSEPSAGIKLSAAVVTYLIGALLGCLLQSFMLLDTLYKVRISAVARHEGWRALRRRAAAILISPWVIACCVAWMGVLFPGSAFSACSSYASWILAVGAAAFGIPYVILVRRGVDAKPRRISSEAVEHVVNLEEIRCAFELPNPDWTLSVREDTPAVYATTPATEQEEHIEITVTGLDGKYLMMVEELANDTQRRYENEYGRHGPVKVDSLREVQDRDGGCSVEAQRQDAEGNDEYLSVALVPIIELRKMLEISCIRHEKEGDILADYAQLLATLRIST